MILQVTDQGPGIPSTDQQHIFDKFYRGSNIPPEVDGSGLGLAIVKTIVENHQGRIWVESELGKGSSFFIVLTVVSDHFHLIQQLNFVQKYLINVTSYMYTFLIF